MDIREHLHLPHRRHFNMEAEFLGTEFGTLTEEEQRTLEIESHISTAQRQLQDARLIRQDNRVVDLEAALTAEKIAKESFSRVVELTYRNSYALAVATVGLRRQDVAEEALSAAYASAYRALPSFRREAKFETWLYRIVKNKSHTYRDRELRFERKHAATLDDEFIDDVLFVSPTSTETEGIKFWQNERLKDALNLLKEKDRQVVVLKYMYDLPYEKIVDIMGGNENSLKVRAHRALKKLKVALHTFGIHEQSDLA